MKSPRCTNRACKHAMSEHGPNGCDWCKQLGRSCTVVGAHAKPWESTLEEQVQLLLATPRGESRDRLLRSLHSGHDAYSRMSGAELLRHAPDGTPASTEDSVLRWVVRGLPIAVAYDKVRLDEDVRAGRAAAYGKAGSGD